MPPPPSHFRLLNPEASWHSSPPPPSPPPPVFFEPKLPLGSLFPAPHPLFFVFRFCTFLPPSPAISVFMVDPSCIPLLVFSFPFLVSFVSFPFFPFSFTSSHCFIPTPGPGTFDTICALVGVIIVFRPFPLVPGSSLPNGIYCPFPPPGPLTVYPTRRASPFPLPPHILHTSALCGTLFLCDSTPISPPFCSLILGLFIALFLFFSLVFPVPPR